MLRVLLLVAVSGSAAWADKPPRDISSIELDYKWVSFRRKAFHYKLEWRDTQYIVTDTKVAVDRKVVEAVVASLTNLRETSGDLRCISHTDDYPHFTVTLSAPSEITLTTDSNCHSNVPWNVLMNGKKYSQFSDAIPKAVYALFAATDAANWKGTPVSFSDGAESVHLGRYEPGQQQADPAAAACVKDLGSSAKVKAVFGENLTATSLDLSCELTTSPSCTDVTATFEAMWHGVELRYAMSCAGGVVFPSPANTAEIARVRGLIDSKVVRALVAQAGLDPVRAWNYGEWSVQAGTDGPTLTWRGSKTIHVRAMSSTGPAARSFLKELGIDAAKYTKHKTGDVFWVTELDVDFVGKPAR